MFLWQPVLPKTPCSSTRQCIAMSCNRCALFLNKAGICKRKKSLSQSHCVKDQSGGLQTGCWDHPLHTQGRAASRGDAAGGQRNEQGVLPSWTTAMSRRRALCPHVRWKTSKPHAKGVWHCTILLHSREKSVLLLLQAISLLPMHLLPAKNTHLQGNADPYRCCLGRGNPLFKAEHPGMKQGLSCKWWMGLSDSF